MNKPSITSKSAGFASDNATAAAIILENPAKYGGEEAAVVQWARLWAARNAKVSDDLSPPVDREEASQGKLW